MYQLTAVMPVFNQEAFVEAAITSFLEKTLTPARLVIVDNHSSLPTRQVLNQFQSHPGVTIIWNHENRGFPSAVNQAMAINGSPYFAILNSDLVFTPSWDVPLLDTLQSHEKIGIVGPVSNSVRKGCQIEPVPYKHPEDSVEYSCTRSKPPPHFCTSLSGFCWIQKSELIRTVGIFDEQFSPGNFEDNDYCLRALSNGYKLIANPKSFIHHHGSASFRTLDHKFDQIILKNLNYYLEKSIQKFNASPTGEAAFELAIKLCEKEEYHNAWKYLEHALSQDAYVFRPFIPSLDPLFMTEMNVDRLSDVITESFAKDAGFIFLMLALCILYNSTTRIRKLLTLYKTIADFSHSVALSAFIREKISQIPAIKS